MSIELRRAVMAAMSITTPLVLGATSPALAQGLRPGEGPLEELIVTGVRGEARSVTDSTVPIDVLGADEFANQGDTDLSNLLRNVVPSYNVNSQPISDAATIVRPANLRGLAPDHTLVLINGKRRHRAAVIYWLGNGVSDGAQGPDISAIPSSALKRVEVLRDGASAQYGSDAIAGVMNFILNDANEGAYLETRYGSYYAGDGDQYAVSGNIGLPLTSNGFANFSFEYGEADPTDRSVQRDDAAALIAAGNTAVKNPAQIWGTPEVQDDLKIFGNLGVDLSESLELYGHGNYVSKTAIGGFYYRNPNTRAAVFSADDGETLLIGDLTPTDAQTCPTVTITNNVPDPAALGAGIRGSELLLVPGNVPRRLYATVRRRPRGLCGGGGHSGHGGRAMSHWDFSAGYGSNRVDFFISNTVNASFGPDTPTTFDPGSYIQEELNVNFDVSYDLNDAVTLAGGAEYRDETFEIEAGQVESWDFGPLADQGFSAASNGFPGFSDEIAGSWSRCQLRAVWRRGVARDGSVAGRPGRALGGLRRLRHDDELQGCDELPLQRRVCGPRQLEHGFPGADARAVECIERDDPVRPRSQGTGQSGHDSVDQPGGGAARRRGTRTRGVGELQRRRDRRARRIQSDGRLLLDRGGRSPRGVAGLRAYPGRSRGAGGIWRHERGESAELPFLHQRFRYRDQGSRRRGDL